MVVIADDEQVRAHLGAFPLPVEIVRFGWTLTRRAVAELLADMDVEGDAVDGARRARRGRWSPTRGTIILDLHLRRIGDPPALAAALTAMPGVVEHGLFIDMAGTVVIGRRRRLDRGAAPAGRASRST